ncbi:hypothetical protein [Sphingomonas abietis]|uniref:Uncharacterized protein n=1 Tax=Sphingomonas abietis TaxID=3012344 RepID=A0ABY7NMQ9_9SPHN|nr:hypothetical protein [Sphingomonas abietis]WBO22812.1 hypothetical protein PBT88_01270 [Sphingomonas abietis]
MARRYVMRVPMIAQTAAASIKGGKLLAMPVANLPARSGKSG